MKPLTIPTSETQYQLKKHKRVTTCRTFVKVRAKLCLKQKKTMYVKYWKRKRKRSDYKYEFFLREARCRAQLFRKYIANQE